MGRFKWIAITLGAVLTLTVLGTALAEPPAPGTPKPTPPAGTLGDMRSWMDSYFGQGTFDRMHSSWEGMVDTCNSIMGEGGMMGGAGGMMGGPGGMMGGAGGMMGGAGGMMGNGSRTGPGTRTSTGQGTYGGMMGGNWAPRSGGWGGMMGNFMGGIRNTMLPPVF